MAVALLWMPISLTTRAGVQHHWRGWGWQLLALLPRVVQPKAINGGGRGIDDYTNVDVAAVDFRVEVGVDSKFPRSITLIVVGGELLE